MRLYIVFWLTSLLGINLAQKDPYITNNLNENSNANNENQLYNTNNANPNYNPGFNYPDLNQGTNYSPGSTYNQNTNYNRDVNYPNTNYPTYGYGGNYGYGNPDELQCPENWLRFQNSCYKFVKSPRKAYKEARKICQTYSPDGSGSDLVSLNSPEKHGFLTNQLNTIDSQHRYIWYIGAHQSSPNTYTNIDGSQLANIEKAKSDAEFSYGKDYLAYNFSRNHLRWVFEPVVGDEPLLFICEAQIGILQRLVVEDRNFMYGVDVTDPEKIPIGPYFIQQPVDATFDISRKNLYNDVSISCLAGGYPTPTYEWYREDYENDRLVAHKIDPLLDIRYTISGGTLIIHNPQQKDHATYHCKATNKFGTIISESVQLNFGFILEFVLKRSPESGDQNWGKSIYCDPPNHFPSVRYSWSRDYFPNFVEEDRRVFSSNDGALYFSALETIDRANYSCSVNSEFSDSGRNGPFFPLRVNPHSNYQQLKFPNNFPKAFPEAPTAGKDVRLECVAFGYPVPSYNWTRKGGSLPRSAYLTSFNRVLNIPKVQVEDEGEYICRAYNDRASIENSVFLNIQAEPTFTIPLKDRHMDSKSELVWTCEAFGIPDVNYTWWKNGRQLVQGYLDIEDRGRIKIQDNVLTISYLDQERDPGMYQCRASNTLKTSYSSAQLRVLVFKPSFKKNPLEFESYAAEGGNVTIKCNPEAAPRPKFIWKKDGNVIGSGGHRRIFENGNLYISPVSRDDEGIYICTASNELGIDESRGRLIVMRGPRLVEPLRETIVTSVGRNIDLRCYAVTDEMLDIAYIWKHNGMIIRDIDVRNSYNRIKIDGGYLRIINSTFSDTGDYECVVKSAVGRIFSRALVIVEGPPGPPGGVKVLDIKKTSVTLQWTDGASHGSPIHSYTISSRTNWNQTWVNITHGVRASEIDRYTRRKEAVIDNNLIPWAVHEFRVAAWNNLGMGAPSQPSPKYPSPPDRPYIAPRNIGGGGGKIGDLTIRWDPLKADEQNAPGIHYKIFWKRKDGEVEFKSQKLEEYGNVGEAVVYIDSQYYYTEYVVKVQAFNSEGAGPISHEVVIYSAEDMPQVAPQLVVAKSFNSTALNVSWVPVDQSRESIRGKLIGHRIKYWKKGSNEQDAVYYLSRKTRPWALIVGLQPDTYYFVKAMVYNSAGEGPESERFIERTYRKAPQKPPSSVMVYGINPSTVKVVWRYVQPSLEEEPLQGYKIRVWESDQDLSTANDTIIPFGGNLEGYVTNLSPGKVYKLRVLAYSNGGDGRMSSPEKQFQMGEPQYFRSAASDIQISLLSIAITLAVQFVYKQS
ncbi:contactin [Diorhabda carinulata]|uniref:contactin n=1 Tax=Diorhabda carinulata TaxID=1163345 RepID=UPI0025A208DF|nr:contactin [Diorhabda carinulata]